MVENEKMATANRSADALQQDGPRFDLWSLFFFCLEFVYSPCARLGSLWDS